MNPEALFWLGVILSSPAIVMLTKVFTIWFLDIFISDDTIIITEVDKHGNESKKRIRLNSNDELISLLKEIKSGQSSLSKEASS